MALRAPLSLKLPVNCLNSAFKNTLAPTNSEINGLSSQAVRLTPPLMATSAREISAKEMGKSVKSLCALFFRGGGDDSSSCSSRS